MAGADQKSPPGHNYIELYKRRLKRSPSVPSDSAAGLLSGHRYHGRPTPVRGHGSPPPDDKTEAFVPGRHLVQGKSHVSSIGDVLGPAREVVGPQAGLDPSSKWAGYELPNCRRTPQSYTSHLTGGGVTIVAQEATYEPARRPRTAGAARTDRVLGLDAEPAEPTYLLLANAQRDLFLSSRPTTAPACVLRTRQLMRTGYDVSRALHDDVLTYRHSGGICPSEYKLSTDRTPAPPVAGLTQEQARASFFDARSAMAANKLRGAGSVWGEAC